MDQSFLADGVYTRKATTERSSASETRRTSSIVQTTFGMVEESLVTTYLDLSINERTFGPKF